MAPQVITLLAPEPLALAIAIAADLAFGDPVFRFHPVRLMGDALVFFERRLRSIGADGYGGGIALYVILSSIFVAAVTMMIAACLGLAGWLAWIFHALVLYSLIALGDLLRHAWRVEFALSNQSLAAARLAVAMLVGRDVDRMDEAACRRATIESMSENLPDGFVSPLFWYVVAGLPGLVAFKVASTMDSMIGYKTRQYRQFGWCGARVDDLMNYLPARLSALLIVAVAVVTPNCSARMALRIALAQHSALPSPNSGWSEAAMAGAIRRRLVGPIWNDGTLVTEIWLGDPSDPPASSGRDMLRAATLVLGAGLAAAVLALLAVPTWLWAAFD